MARPALGSSSPLTRCRWFMARSKASRTAFRMREEWASFSLILSSVWLIPKGAILDLGSHCLKRERKEKTEFSVSCFRLHQWPHSLCSAYSLTCTVDGDDSLKFSFKLKAIQCFSGQKSFCPNAFIVNSKWTCISVALFQSADQSKRFTTLVRFTHHTHTHTHSYTDGGAAMQGVNCSSGAIWGSVSCAMGFHQLPFDY